jgi:hypothetical protein
MPPGLWPAGSRPHFVEAASSCWTCPRWRAWSPIWRTLPCSRWHRMPLPHRWTGCERRPRSWRWTGPWSNKYLYSIHKMKNCMNRKLWYFWIFFKNSCFIMYSIINICHFIYTLNTVLNIILLILPFGSFVWWCRAQCPWGGAGQFDAGLIRRRRFDAASSTLVNFFFDLIMLHLLLTI